MDNNIFEQHIVNNKMLPFIFHLDRVDGGFSSSSLNWHANIEILYCISGEGAVFCGPRRCEFTPGTVVIANSYVIHNIVSETGVRYYCLIPDRDFCRENGVPTESLHFSEIITDREITDKYLAIINAFATNAKCPSRTAEVRCAVLGLLAALYKNHAVSQEEVNVPDDYNAERIKNAVRYIRQNYMEKITLDGLAEHCGVSKYHLARQFKKYAGQTIFEHINSVRCKEAKKLIDGGSSVYAAAVTCGFENMSYFSRTYKKYIGTLPSKG